MKSKRLLIVLILLSFFVVSLSASLVDIYKSGKLKLVPDPNFGKGTEWEIYFPQGILDIAFTKDGSFFATRLGNKACHCVYKFDKNGRFIKKIGRRGRGPGDLYRPGALSILDNKYLLIAEYPSSRRISVFDLNGNFIKIIRTQEPVFDVVGLKNGKIAIKSEKYLGVKKGRISVYIIDVKNNEKRIVYSIEIKICIKKTPKTTLIEPSIQKRVFIGKTGKNLLIVGCNYNNKLSILSEKGNKIKEINLDIPIIRADKNKIKKYWDEEKEYQIKKYGKEYLEYYKTHTYNNYYKSLFSNIFPIYNNLISDSANNIIVIYYKGHYFLKHPLMRVYSPIGKFISEIKLDFSKYKIGRIDIRSKGLYFFNNYLLLFSATNKKGEDFPSLVKLNLLK